MEESKISFKEAIFGFFLFIFVQMILFPAFVFLILRLSGFREEGSSDFSLSFETLGWLNFTSIMIVATLLLIFVRMNKVVFAPLFYTEKPILKFLKGVLTWFIAFPLMMLVSASVVYILTNGFGFTLLDQNVVRQMKEMKEHKLLFFMTAVAVISIVPIIEEFLFRGLLLTSLKNVFSNRASIVITAALFASFHLSLSQGINNVNIGIALFILALFLGALRVKDRCLISSIALHSTFNGVSIGLILLE